MRWRVPRFGIFFMVVLIVMGLGLVFISNDDEDAGSDDEPASTTEAAPGSRP